MGSVDGVIGSRRGEERAGLLRPEARPFEIVLVGLRGSVELDRTRSPLILRMRAGAMGRLRRRDEVGCLSEEDVERDGSRGDDRGRKESEETEDDRSRSGSVAVSTIDEDEKVGNVDDRDIPPS